MTQRNQYSITSYLCEVAVQKASTKVVRISKKKEKNLDQNKIKGYVLYSSIR